MPVFRRFCHDHRHIEILVILKDQCGVGPLLTIIGRALVDQQVRISSVEFRFNQINLDIHVVQSGDLLADNFLSRTVELIHEQDLDRLSGLGIGQQDAVHHVGFFFGKSVSLHICRKGHGFKHPDDDLIIDIEGAQHG